MARNEGDISRTNAAVHLGLAGQLVQDLRDLRNGVSLEEDAEITARVGRFRQFVEKAANAAIPVFKERAEATTSGNLSPPRVKRWVSLDSDQEPFKLIQEFYGGDQDPKLIKRWATATIEVLSQLEEGGWENLGSDQKGFLKDEVEPLLERLERLDEAPSGRRIRRNAAAA